MQCRPLKCWKGILVSLLRAVLKITESTWKCMCTIGPAERSATSQLLTRVCLSYNAVAFMFLCYSLVSKDRKTSHRQGKNHGAPE